MLYRIISLVILFVTFHHSYLISVENNDFIYPKNKPSIFKKIPIKKPLLEKNKISNNIFLEPKSKPIIKKDNIQIKVKIKKKDIDKTKSTKENKFKLQKIITKSEKVSFVYPKNKPVSYKITSTKVKKSNILKTKDFARAKEIFKYIGAGKWNSALKLTEKTKDQEFRNLINLLKKIKIIHE